MQPNPSIYPLQLAQVACGGGVLGLTFCPGMNTDDARTRRNGGTIYRRNLADDLGVLRQWGAMSVLTLLEDMEFRHLGVQGLGQAVIGMGMAWYHMPIPDLRAPGDAFERAWSKHYPTLRAQLAAGGRILIHCRHGRGRTGTIAARFLIESGFEPVRAVEAVRAVAPACIATSVQEAYLLGMTPPKV